MPDPAFNPAEPATTIMKDDVWCVIPVYNNSATIRQVAVACRELGFPVLVVDDGSTETPVTDLLDGTRIPVLTHAVNQGKGRAILSALSYVKSKKGRFMITIDGDGQHNPADIERFIPCLQKDPTSIVIGCRNMEVDHVPDYSKFGRAFSNFWLQLETGVAIPDTQSGFRAYPVDYLAQLKLKGHRYEFEVEVLARAVWAGIHIQSVNVSVWYPPKEERVTSFHPFRDNVRISLTHARLITRRLMPWPVKKLIRRPHDLSFFRSPKRFILMLLNEHVTPLELGVSAGVGTFIAVLPIFAFHTVVIIFVATRLNLNRIMAVAIQNLCAPPFVPLFCIQIGHYLRQGSWLTEASKQTVIYQGHFRLLEWGIGAFFVAPVLAILVGLIVFLLARILQRLLHKKQAKK
jgi:glycosyltransferase involved in cell wall biosynthesis